MEERLQKILSRAGVSSRRKAEELIAQGAVSVNDRIVTELGSKANFERDRIRVNGQLLNKPSERLYFMLNKPKGYITSTEDPEGRPTVTKLLGRLGKKVYPVGRLDFASEGLLLLTNDGDFANRVMSAKEKLPKSYLVKVNALLDHKSMEQFREGIYIDGRRTAPAQIRLTTAAANPWYEVVLTEGRNRQIRRMFLRFGVLVEKLRRTKIGPLSLGKLASGDFRPLTPREIERVLAAPTEAPRNERRKARTDSKPGSNNRRRRSVR
jgi:23S rRNA pseudouridine2605 synthase